MEFHFEIIHKPGRDNFEDYLSRLPMKDDSKKKRQHQMKNL
jgi:hypothetical protein